MIISRLFFKLLDLRTCIEQNKSTFFDYIKQINKKKTKNIDKPVGFFRIIELNNHVYIVFALKNALTSHKKKSIIENPVNFTQSTKTTLHLNDFSQTGNGFRLFQAFYFFDALHSLLRTVKNIAMFMRDVGQVRSIQQIDLVASF